MRTVARSKLHLISELDLDVRLRLKTLQDHFRITSQQQVLELSSQYADVQQRRKNQDINSWLDEYSRISSLCQSEDMAEMKGTRPQWAFIQAVQAQGDTDWSGQHFTLMIGCEEDDKPPPTLEGLINLYKRWVSTKRLHTKTLGSFAAQDATKATLSQGAKSTVIRVDFFVSARSYACTQVYCRMGVELIKTSQVRSI
jgi:hypothetical protein